MLLFDYTLELSLGQLDQLEGFFVLLTHIIAVLQAVQVELQMEHLFILRIVIEAHNWHSIVQLERERVHAIVDQDDITECTLVEYAHIFDVEVWVACPDAARSEVSRLDQTAIRVQIVNDRICVLLFRGRENDDLEVLVGRLEALSSEWTYVDAGKNGFGLLAKLNWDNHVGVLRLYIINTVNQCLIKIEYDCLCLRWVIWLR